MNIIADIVSPCLTPLFMGILLLPLWKAMVITDQLQISRKALLKVTKMLAVRFNFNVCSLRIRRWQGSFVKGGQLVGYELCGVDEVANHCLHL